MGNNNKTLVYVLGGIAGALLLALVGVLAYNAGKDKSSEEANETNTNTEMAQQQAIAPMGATSTDIAPEAARPAAPDPEPQVDARTQSHWHLVGTIAGKGVVMDLENYGGSVSGSYYYKKFGANSILKLNGDIDGSGNINLTEFNSDRGYDTGWLNGHLTSSGALTGSFTNSNGNTYRVSLKVR